MSNFKSGSSANDVDIYGGFTNKLASLYDNSGNEDEAFQNVIKNSSYGRKNTTTPKFNWVILFFIEIWNINSVNLSSRLVNA